MARQIKNNRKEFGEGEFIEMRIHEVPISAHFPQGIKYSLSYIKNWVCILRYDNERGKGHHMHFMGNEQRTEFADIDALIEIFERQIEKLRGDKNEGEKRND